ncbi:MAG: DUF1727 domain-containing protein [Clostridia bacterium]|nr:DUF1727 domain-containing protein [Clostridia bacterium]
MIRFLLAVWACKMLIIAGRMAGKKSSSGPGEIAMKICPDILKILSKKVKKQIIAVCGTNGKTTTNNMICSILEKKGYSVVCNKIGANMLPGTVTAFIEKTGFFGKINADYATLEIDEASARHIFKHLNPDVMLITNLFRDQLDRYGEIEMTAGFLKEALDLTKDTTLIINGDDPVCAAIAKDYGKKVIAFGISENADINLDEAKEGQFCKYCGKPLEYEYYHYSQLGSYKCPGCDFKRPEISVEATGIDISDGLKFTVNKKNRINVAYRGFYNIYNILAALAVSEQINVDLSDINEILSDYKPQIGRMEKFDLGKPVILNLAKNPAGFNQAIFTVLADDKKKDIIVAINDNPGDGKDVSWIWDVDFEKLSDCKVGKIAYLGIRKYDLEVRFKYADINKEGKVYNDLKTAIKEMLQKDGEILYLLVNYTVIFEAQNILKELEKEYRKEG